MSRFLKDWLKPVPWSVVVTINVRLCQAAHADHKPTSEGYEPARTLWEANRAQEIGLKELLKLAFKCHRLAPFCNYNGNTFVAVVKTLLSDVLKEVPPGKAHILRSIAGHIVAGTATDIEEKQFDKLLADLDA